MPMLSEEERLALFDHQVDQLLKKGYPKAAGVTELKFLEYLTPLKDKVRSLTVDKPDFEKGYLPFVIVVKNELVDTQTALERVDFKGKSGFINLTPHTSDTFQPITSVSIPESLVYLLVDIDRGYATRNVTPDEAFTVISKQNRSPLTIDEGVNLITHYPEFLVKNNCFSLLASRTGDKRVPALWISNSRPRLGWCWAGNPHTWLGSASACCRIGV